MSFQEAAAPTPGPRLWAQVLRSLERYSRLGNKPGETSAALPTRRLRLDHLILYFAILTVLAIYGGYRVKQVIDFSPYRKFVPEPNGRFNEEDLPIITVQLPLFNEMYVVRRLVKAITEIDYPRDKFQIQVLDDSTDETVKLARETVDEYARQGFDIEYIHREDRTGFKAGALENGMNPRRASFSPSSMPTFVPKPECLRKLVATLRFHGWVRTDALVAYQCQLQPVKSFADHMLDGHFVVERPRAIAPVASSL